MDLIQRYVYSVTQSLPEDMRMDVSQELNTLITDMLPDNPCEEDIKKVLEELGNPRKLASEYSPIKRYLIGPSFYESYISTLKLVVVIVAVVLGTISILQWAYSQPDLTLSVEPIVKLFTTLLTSVMQAIFQAFLWVTIVFAIMERVEEENGKSFVKKWTVDRLPKETEDSKKKISRIESVIGLFFTLFFAVVIILQPQMIAMYVKSNGGLEVTQVFNFDILRSYYPAIIALTTIELGILLWKLIERKWTYKLAGAVIVQNIFSCILVINMLRNISLFSSEFFVKASGYLKISLDQMNGVWNKATLGFVIFFCVVSVIDGISSLYKASR